MVDSKQYFMNYPRTERFNAMEVAPGVNPSRAWHVFRFDISYHSVPLARLYHIQIRVTVMAKHRVLLD